jgi:hypothetical protein
MRLLLSLRSLVMTWFERYICDGASEARHGHSKFSAEYDACLSRESEALIRSWFALNEV